MPGLENLDKPADQLSRRGLAADRIPLVNLKGQTLADHLPQMVWIVSAADRSLLYANPSFQAYFGAVEPRWEHRSRHFHPDDLGIIQTAFDTVMQEGVTSRKKVRILGRDGHHRWHDIMLVAVRKDGAIVEWVVTTLDVHEMTTSAQKLQEATDLFSLSQDAAGAGSWDLDLRTGAVKLSRESARLHGLGDDPAEMDLDGWKRIVNADDAKTVLDALQAAVDTKTTFNGEFRVDTPTSGLRWLSGIGRAYYDTDGAPIRMIGLNFDITDRKAAEADLLHAHAEAEAAKRLAELARQHAEKASLAKSDFLASMSHEIRTPLNSIIGYTDLMMEDVEQGSPMRRKLEVVQESGAALLTVVNDILDFSKIEAGQIELDPIVFSPRALLDNVCSIMSGQARRKGISLTRHVSLNMPDFVLGDEGRLRQILLNLVNNAVKFTDAGHVAVNMEQERSTSLHDRETIRFSVTDSGMGISVAQQTRLFQRFSQVDGSISRRFGGTGLGLAICKQLIDLMGGKIGVKSREGEGASFWFKVDLPSATAPDAQRKESQSAPQGSTRSVRILLAEDVQVNQELAKAVLERAGHVVDIAVNGREALEAVQSSPYDLVLMDVQMPIMDGLAATQAIRGLNHDCRAIPIIAMTANVLPQQVAGLKAAGMDDHVGKPFRRQELLAVIDRWACARDAADETARVVGTHETRVDLDAFGTLEDLVGAPSLRVMVAKMSAEMTARFRDLGTIHDLKRLEGDAHAMIQPAGMFGFVRLASLCRRCEGLAPDADGLEALLRDLDAERREVIADLDRYLVSSSGRS